MADGALDQFSWVRSGPLDTEGCEQVTTPYDLTAFLRVALREYAPDRMVLPGPGNTLGGVVAQVMIAEGWRGLRSKADFQVMQKSEDPPIESMRRA